MDRLSVNNFRFYGDEIGLLRANSEKKTLDNLIHKACHADLEVLVGMKGSVALKTSKFTKILYERWEWISSGTTLYAFDGQIYQEITQVRLQRIIAPLWNMCWHDFVPNVSKNIYGLMLSEALLDDPLQINNYPDLLPFKNCLMQVDEDNRLTPVPYSITTYLTSQIPWNFPKKIECPLFIYFLNTILPDKKSRERVLAHIASCFLSRRNKHQMGQIWLGTGGSGKSILASFVAHLIGREFLMRRSLIEITDDKFGKISYKGKKVHISSEIGGFTLSIKMQEFLKEVLGEDYLETRGLHSPTELFTNYCKHIYMANRLPFVTNPDISFWDRFDIILFVKRFRNTKWEDKDLLEDMVKYESEGALGYILSYLPRIENILSKTEPDKVQEMWSLYTSNVYPFINEECAVGDDVFCKRTELYMYYKAWCKEKKEDYLSPKHFGRILERQGYVTTKNQANQERNVLYLQGITIRDGIFS